MADYPTDPAEREARRRGVRRQMVAAAEANAYRVVRSMTCGEYQRHAPNTTCRGAKVCLCECHDQPESATEKNSCEAREGR